MSSIPVMSKVQVHGHRGCRAVLPENTLPAFEEALRVGVDVLEMDVGITKDRIPVLSHDPYINNEICQFKDGRKITSKIPIFSLTLREIKEFDCGALKNPKFPKQRPVPHTPIPTLEEVFNLVFNSKEPSAKTVEFNIETKITEDHPELAPAPEEFTRLILDLVRKYNLKDRVILQSFDYRTLREAKKQMPDLRVSALAEGFFTNIIQIAQKERVEILSPDFSLLSQRKVAQLHQMGLKVIPWTLNKQSQWRRALEWGVDGIITDDPQALLAFLKQQKP